MRTIRFLGLLLTLATAIVATAIVASEIATSAHEQADRTARACQANTCPLSATTPKSTIELDIRVMEINVTRMKALGFDFWSIRGPDVPWEQQIGSVGSGVSGFLDALDREGLVQQDITLSQQIADGESWKTALRWRVPDTQGTKSAWRTLHLRVRPTLLHAQKTRLETACAAEFSKTAPDARHVEDNTMVDFTAEVDHQMLCLNANFIAADPGQFPKDEVRVVVLITPLGNRASEESVDGESHPDLLAPRNVLGHHAADRSEP